jgi:hypothetical protein
MVCAPAIMGLFNAVLLAPMVIAMHETGYESLSALTFPIFALILVKGLFDNVISGAALDTLLGRCRRSHADCGLRIVRQQTCCGREPSS